MEGTIVELEHPINESLTLVTPLLKYSRSIRLFAVLVVIVGWVRVGGNFGVVAKTRGCRVRFGIGCLMVLRHRLAEKTLRC